MEKGGVLGSNGVGAVGVSGGNGVGVTAGGVSPMDGEVPLSGEGGLPPKYPPPGVVGEVPMSGEAGVP